MKKQPIGEHEIQGIIDEWSKNIHAYKLNQLLSLRDKGGTLVVVYDHGDHMEYSVVNPKGEQLGTIEIDK